MPRPLTVGDLLREVSTGLADAFDDVPVPAAFPLPGAVDVDVDVAARERAYDLGTAERRAVILAGPRAVPYRDGLHALAARLNAPVANTWGAKGVLPWDDPHHMGTCGLQERDFELLGFADYDVLIATGIDPDESPRARYALTDVVEIAPLDLERVANEAAPRAFPIEANALYAAIAAVARPGYVDESQPRHPPRAVMDLKRSLPPHAIVFGQPGPAGLWLARTFPTDRAWSICVPAVARPGIAAALALVTHRRGGSAVVVVTDPPDPVTRVVRELAPDLRIERWGGDVDWSRTEELIDAAGPVVAWT